MVLIEIYLSFSRHSRKDQDFFSQCKIYRLLYFGLAWNSLYSFIKVAIIDFDTFLFSVREFLNFSCKVVVERTKMCSRAAVEEKGTFIVLLSSLHLVCYILYRANQTWRSVGPRAEYVCHVCVRADGLAGVVVSDRTYPDRVAQTLVSRILDEFAAQYPENTWGNLTHLGYANAAN